MLGLGKVGLIGTGHITCHSHNGNLRSLCNLHGIHHILHGILHSHSRAQPRPHACRSSHHGSHRSSCSLRILHGILRSRSRAQPQPHACRSSPCCSRDHNHHSLRILHGSLRIHHIHSKAQPRPWVRHQLHACHSSPCCNRIRHSLRIHHGSLRIHRIRSKAQPRPLACHSIPCILQDCIHHNLCTRRSLRIHRIRSKAQLQHLPRLQARQPQGPPGRELRASSCCQLLEWMSTPH